MPPVVLEPRLTKADLRVLRALPEWSSPWGNPHYTKAHPVSVWRLGEQLRVLDLADLLRTLRGLAQLGYVFQCGDEWSSRWPVRWMRTEKGDQEVERA